MAKVVALASLGSFLICGGVVLVGRFDSLWTLGVGVLGIGVGLPVSLHSLRVELT